MAWFFSYVVFMLVALPVPPNLMPMSFSILMGFPNMIAAPLCLIVCLLVAGKLKLKIVPIYIILAASSLGGGVISGVISEKPGSFSSALTLQLLIYIFQAHPISYFIGLVRGLGLANVEARYPLVLLTTSNGKTRGDLRLLKVCSSDCRFIEADGTVSLIPNSRIASIRTI